MNDEQFYALYEGWPGEATSAVTRLVTIPMCPDLLEYSMIGEADNVRGRIVRAFFWLMRVWPI